MKTTKVYFREFTNENGLNDFKFKIIETERIDIDSVDVAMKLIGFKQVSIHDLIEYVCMGCNPILGHLDVTEGVCIWDEEEGYILIE